MPHVKHDMLLRLGPLLAAEASAEAHATGTEPADLEQAVWLRLLEHLRADGPPADPQGWLRRAVRAESRRTRRTHRRERPYDGDPADDAERDPAQLALTAARGRAARGGRPAPRPLPAAGRGPVVAAGPDLPGDRGGVGYLTGLPRTGTFQMSRMSAEIARPGGCGGNGAGIGVGDNR